MSYLDQLMGTNEKVVFGTRKHIVVIAQELIGTTLVAVVIAAAAFFAGALTGGLGSLLGVLIVIPLARLLWVLLQWSNEKYIVTNRRVMKMEGFINKHVADSSLEKVNDVVLNQSWLGRLLDYGNVDIITGSDVGVNHFEQIAQPVAFKREMLNQKENLGAVENLQTRTQRVLTSEAPSARDIPELIAELDELRDKGIISDAEFEAKKADLLKRL